MTHPVHKTHELVATIQGGIDAESGMYTEQDQAEAALRELAERLETARRLLQESYGWMNGIEPKPAQPFLDEVASYLDKEQEDDLQASLEEADRDLAEGRARPASDVFRDLGV